MTRTATARAPWIIPVHAAVDLAGDQVTEHGRKHEADPLHKVPVRSPSTSRAISTVAAGYSEVRDADDGQHPGASGRTRTRRCTPRRDPAESEQESRARWQAELTGRARRHHQQGRAALARPAPTARCRGRSCRAARSRWRKAAPDPTVSQPTLAVNRTGSPSSTAERSSTADQTTATTASTAR